MENGYGYDLLFIVVWVGLPQNRRCLQTCWTLVSWSEIFSGLFEFFKVEYCYRTLLYACMNKLASSLFLSSFYKLWEHLFSCSPLISSEFDARHPWFSLISTKSAFNRLEKSTYWGLFVFCLTYHIFIWVKLRRHNFSIGAFWPSH